MVKKFYRWMSIKEFQLFSAGVEIKGKKDHKSRTDSTGVCFLPEDFLVEADYGLDIHICPKASLCFLSGIVSDDVLVEFEADENLLKKGKGIYANPSTDLWDDYVSVEEYCIPAYSLDTFKAKRYFLLDNAWARDLGKGTWYAYNG